MNQAPHLRLATPGSPPGLPREPLSPEKQLEAIRLVQNQAEQRVSLGVQLFKAAEAHTAHQQELIEELKSHQEQIRQEMQHDIASSLQTYDQWMATFDENFTRKLQRLEEKLDQKVAALEGKWGATQQLILEMVRRAEALLDQSRQMLKAAVQQPAAPARRPKRPSKPSAKAPNKPSVTPAAYAIIKPPTQKFLPRPKAQAVPPTQTPQKTMPPPKTEPPSTPAADCTDKPPIQSTPSAPTTAPPSNEPPKAATEQPDMIFSKALEHLKADPANNPPQGD